MHAQTGRETEYPDFERIDPQMQDFEETEMENPEMEESEHPAKW